MTIQNINIGQIANDGTGDDLREAFRKVNENFDELDLRQPEATTAASIGSGEAIFSAKVGDQLQFKNVTAGTKINVASVAGNNVQISADLSGVLFVSDLGSNNVDDGETLNIYGGTGISTKIIGNTLTITNEFEEGVSTFTNELDFGGIDFSVTSHADYLRFSTDVEYGTITAKTEGLTSDMGAI